MIPRVLDARFALIVGFLLDPEATPKTRAVARRQAEVVATECGFGFEEALRWIGRRVEDIPSDAAPSVQIGGIKPSAQQGSSGREAARERVATALIAGPSKSDREIGRTCHVSPSTVAKVRGEMGLARDVRTVVRGGVSFGMRAKVAGREPSPKDGPA